MVGIQDQLLKQGLKHALVNPGNHGLEGVLVVQVRARGGLVVEPAGHGRHGQAHALWVGGLPLPEAEGGLGKGGVEQVLGDALGDQLAGLIHEQLTELGRHLGFCVLQLEEGHGLHLSVNQIGLHVAAKP